MVDGAAVQVVVGGVAAVLAEVKEEGIKAEGEEIRGEKEAELFGIAMIRMMKTPRKLRLKKLLQVKKYQLRNGIRRLRRLGTSKTTTQRLG